MKNAPAKARLGLVEALTDARLPDDMHVLIVIDQFEEIFRFRYRSQKREEERRDQRFVSDERNEAAAFVNMLLTACDQTRMPIYIVLTMRSDFLSDCDAFCGLPEAINESQFLTPRMTREQLESAIRGPVALFNGRIEDGLVNTILNDVGTEHDQLPLMQHALMRTWSSASSRFDSESETSEIKLMVDDYVSIGTVKDAVSRDADEAWYSLKSGTANIDGTSPRQRVARRLFCCLSDRRAEARLTRRLATVQEIAEVAECSSEELLDVISVFRRDGRNFITSSDANIGIQSTLDLSHESLMRQWRRLVTWLDEEEDSVKMYKRLADQAARWEHDKRSPDRLWTGSDFRDALEWRQIQEPNATWAKRYGSNYGVVQDFLKHSEFADKKRTRQDRLRFWLLVWMPIVLLAAITTSWFAASATTAKNYFRAQAELAVEAKHSALAEREEAIIQAERARDAEKQARMLHQVAQEAELSAKNAEEEAHALLARAEKEKNKALDQRKEEIARRKELETRLAELTQKEKEAESEAEKGRLREESQVARTNISTIDTRIEQLDGFLLRVPNVIGD